MRIEGVIFDLDGVLLSTDRLHYEAWKKMADREGIYFDPEINDRLRGVSRMASLEIILERSRRPYSYSEREALADYKNNLYRASLDALSPADLFPRALEFLDYLESRGVRIAVGSSSKNARTILAQVGLMDRFRGAVSDGTNITHSKPDPEVFVKAAEMLGLPPQRCLVIEDAWAGIEAAKAGGMLAMGVANATTHPRVDFSATDLATVLEGRDGPYASFFQQLAPAAGTAGPGVHP